MAIEKRIGAYSAYAIAVENGFTGTEKEWLESLIGPRGYQGWGVSAISVSADGSLIFTVKNPETGETKDLEPIQIETLDALGSISTAKDEAISEAKKAQTQATEAVEASENQALQDISDAKTSATGAVNTAGENAVNSVNSAGQTAVENAQTAITAAKNQAVSDVQSAGQSAVSAVGDARTTAVEAVEDAQTNAVQAVQNAGTNEVEKINDILPVPTEADNGKILTVVGGKWEAIDPLYPTVSWLDVQRIVRLGAAPRYFPVGYEFVTHDNTNDTDIIWRVVGYDTIKAADESLIHTMILETKYVYSDSLGSGIAVQFDAQEALFCVEAGLEPGTYHFTLLSGYDEANGGGGTYSFTLTQFVPSGGVLLFNWQYTLAQNGTISTYTAQTAAEPIETVSVSEGAEGTNLGTDDGSTANMNNTPRARYGSNNYAQSAIRQWLNSAAPAGSVWHPQTKFDRPPNWAGSLAGFMAGLPQDFLAVVQPAAVPCRTNNVFEVDSLDGTEFSISQTYILEDKFFILSCPEIYGSYDNELIKDGEQLDFYQNLTDAERIKYSQLGIATNSGMRSPYVDAGDHFRIINSPSGNFGVRVASGIRNCTASCIIG